MSTGCVIGVDLGGTKLLAGAVDPALDVHHRATRSARGADQSAVLETVVEAVTEVREAVESAGRRVRAVGFGIPCLIDQERGMAVMAVNLPIADVPFRDLMAERLDLPVFVDNDANAAMLAEWRFGAARGASDAALLTIGTGIGGGLVVGGSVARGSIGRGRRARAHGDRDRRAPLPGQLSEPRLPGGARLGHRAGARGDARSPVSAPRRDWVGRGPTARRSRGRSSPSWPTTATPRRSRLWT